MKKIILGVLIAFVVVVLIVVLSISLFLDGAVKRAVETAGPSLTKVEVKLQSVNLSLVSGSGKLKGLVIGNPQGYKTSSAIEVGAAGLSLKPGSVFSDKVIIRAINFDAPEITYETDFKGNNLSTILANMDAATGGHGQPAQPQAAKAARRFQVDDLLITGGKVRVSITALSGQSVTVPLPLIHLTDLGQGPEGITAAELAKLVVQEVEKAAAQAARGQLAELQKRGVVDLTKTLGTNGTIDIDSISKGLGGFLKKK